MGQVVLVYIVPVADRPDKLIINTQLVIQALETHVGALEHSLFWDTGAVPLWDIGMVPLL